MSRENVEIVRKLFDAAARRDSATVLSLYDAHVEWDGSRHRWTEVMGEAGSRFRGHEGLRAWSRQYYETWEKIEDELEELIDTGDDVVSVVTTRAQGRASGVEVEWKHNAGVWTIRDGKIVRVTWFPTRAEALEAARAGRSMPSVTDSLPKRLGVVGAGTMGAGIAQLGALAGIETHVHDPVAEALAGGIEKTRANLAKGAERGRWSKDEADAAADRLHTAAALDGLAGCDFVIEAAPERLDLKRELFQSLSGICGPDAVLATNTSSIPVTFLATAAAQPANVVGMHFFNPAPLMRLVEVIRGIDTSDEALAAARALGEAMGKRVILAADGPGFLVNRCGRPFYTEALRLLQERVATHEQIDRICRLGGGFRMGPFELMDMVGIDVGFEVAKSFNELSFGEPRWRPNPIQERMARGGRHGRKAGRGYYDYTGEGEHRPPDPDPLEPGGGENRAITIAGSGAVVDGLVARANAAGYEVVTEAGDPVEVRALGLPPMVLCADRSLQRVGDPDAIGFNLVPPVEASQLVELTGPRSEQVDLHWHRLGFHTEWVADAPGLVLGRIVAQLVNEALFAVGEGVGSREDVDAGLELGLNHPRGPIAWGEVIGFDRVRAAIDGIWAERREERYRPAPLLGGGTLPA